MPSKRFRPCPYTLAGNEAHLSAQEAEAGKDPRIPRPDEHPWWSRGPEASPAQRSEAPHSLDAVEAPSALPERRVRPCLARWLTACGPLPRPLYVPAPRRGAG